MLSLGIGLTGKSVNHQINPLLLHEVLSHNKRAWTNTSRRALTIATLSPSDMMGGRL